LVGGVGGFFTACSWCKMERTYVLVCKGVKRNVKDMMEDSVLMCLITDQ